MFRCHSLKRYGCLIVLAGGLMGCQYLPQWATSWAAPPAPVAPAAAAAAPEDDPDVAATADYAQRLAKLMDEAEAEVAAPKPSGPPPDVIWISPSVSRRDSTPVVVTPAVADLPPPAVPVRAAPPQPTVATVDDDALPERLDRHELVTALLEQLRESDDPEMVKAVTAAALSMADGRTQFDASTLAGLPAEQRDRVERYHRLITELGRELAAGGSFDRDTIVQRMDDVLDPPAIRIARMELCRRVDGYGVYEPLESTTLLVGRPNRMIVYVELEDFASRQGDDNWYEVRLSQELVLYNEVDGLAVWRRPAEQIVDRSCNRRRDFFIVQVIELPARLSVGKYVLKARVKDVQSEMRDESFVPIDIVADHAMAAGGGRR